MAENDRYRIESRLRGMQRGIAPQPEDIDVLRQRQQQSDKHNQREPERPFSSYLEGGTADGQDTPSEQDDAPAGEASAGEQGVAATPAAGGSSAEIAATPPTAPGSRDRAQADRQAHLLQQRLAERLASRQAEPLSRPTFFDTQKKPPPEGAGRR